jgi:hypothetical protein
MIVFPFVERSGEADIERGQPLLAVENQLYW